jgi:hypothetical protein
MNPHHNTKPPKKTDMTHNRITATKQTNNITFLGTPNTHI